jgi:hypothetical protein
MVKCQGYKKDNTRCTRNTSSGTYCWQHKTEMREKLKLAEPEIKFTNKVLITDNDTETIIYSYMDLDDLLILLDGERDKLDFIIQKYYSGPMSTSELIINGHLNTLKWYAQKQNIRLTNKSMNVASKVGNLKIMKYLYSIGVKPNDNDWDNALKYAHFNIIEYLMTLGYKVSKNSFEYTTNMTTIRWLIVDKKLTPYKTTITRLCGNGDLETVKLFLSFGFLPNDDALECSIVGESLEMVKYLVENNIIVKLKYDHEVQVKLNKPKNKEIRDYLINRGFIEINDGLMKFVR